MVRTRSTAPSPSRPSKNFNKTLVKVASQKKTVEKKKKKKENPISNKKVDHKEVMDELNNSVASSVNEEVLTKKTRKRVPILTITADPSNIDERKVKNTCDVASSDDAATMDAAVTSTAGAAPINGSTIVAAEATGEAAGDNAGCDAVSSDAVVNAPTTTTTTTTKNRKTKGFLVTTKFPVLLDESFAVSFCHDGSNKLIINPTQPPGIGCLHCGKQFNSFGNIAHHVTHTYPREIGKADGSQGDLKK